MKNNTVGSAIVKNNDVKNIKDHLFTILTLRHQYPLGKIGELIGHTEGEIEEYITVVEEKSRERMDKQNQDYKDQVKQYGINRKNFQKTVKTGPISEGEKTEIIKLRKDGNSIYRISRKMNRDVKVIKSVIPSTRFSSYLVPVSN